MNNDQNSFIPKIKSPTLIVDGRATKIIKNLKKNKFRVIPTIKCNELYDAISYHPDIVIHPLDDDTLIIAPNVHEYYREYLKNTGIKIIKGETWLRDKYPKNIAYNVARVSNYAIHNTRFTDEKLKYYLEKKGISFINTNQGYSKCSVANVGKNSIITSDKSIYKAVTKHHIKALLIEQGYIELSGLNYGFIGGSTGLIDEKTILFSGKYDHHPSKNEINKFLKKNGVKPIFISNEKIIDLGSIIPLNCN